MPKTTATAPTIDRATLARVSVEVRDDLAGALAKYGTWITYQIAAELTGSSVRTLKRETIAGRLPCYRIGRARVLRIKTVDVFGLIERVA